MFTNKRVMKNYSKCILSTIFVLLLPVISNAQFSTIGEYSFISKAFYIGKPSDFKESAVIKTITIINISGSEVYKGIQKVNDFDQRSYGFYQAFTNGNQDGVWLSYEDEINKGLIKVIYDPESLVMEFKFKDGISEMHFDVVRTK